MGAEALSGAGSSRSGRSGAGRSVRPSCWPRQGRPPGSGSQVGQAAAGHRRLRQAQARGQGADPARGHAAGPPGAAAARRPPRAVPGRGVGADGPGPLGRGPSCRRRVGRCPRGAPRFRPAAAGAARRRGRGRVRRRPQLGGRVAAGRRARRRPCTSAPGSQHDERISEAIKLAADRGVAVLEAGAAELDRLTGGALHQGLALRVRPYDYAHPDDLLARAADAGQLPLIAALDGVTDPRNLGAVVRSAAAFGAHGVVVPARRGAGVTAGAWKASAGALARVPVARAVNLARALQSYQDAGVFAGRPGRGRGHRDPRPGPGHRPAGRWSSALRAAGCPGSSPRPATCWSGSRSRPAPSR